MMDWNPYQSSQEGAEYATEHDISDPARKRTTVYRYEEDAAPVIIPFEQNIEVGIYHNLSINIEELLK